MDRKVLLLHCMESTAPICRALFQELAKIAPGYALRVNPSSPVPDAFSVTLNLDASGPMLAGSLSWQAGNGRVEHGPVYTSVAIPAKGARVSHPAAQKFAGGVVKITPELRDTLSPTSKP